MKRSQDKDNTADHSHSHQQDVETTTGSTDGRVDDGEQDPTEPAAGFGTLLVRFLQMILRPPGKRC
jgi:hypothetical protein